MHWKPNSWILIGVLLAAALTATGVAQVTTTQVADTIYHADGTAATGTAIVSWPAFTTGAGDAIPSGSVSATIAAGGALSVQLVPNAGATPMGSYYTVVYHLDDGTVSRQYWVVPASSAAVKVSAVESTVLPVSVAMQTVSKSYVDTAIAAAVTGHSLGSAPYVLKAGDTMAGPLLLPADPVSAAQAADKHYVDASVAALSGGSGQNAATPPQTQYAVPAYLLSPSGGLALPGASHLSVDPTGYNLRGYHTNFTNLGVTAVDAGGGDCSQIGGLFGGNSCLGLSAAYPADTGGNELGLVDNFTAYGPGQNLGEDGSPNSRINDAFELYENIRARGGNAANGIVMFGSRVGDWGPWYAYDYTDGGVQAPSDEGTKVIGTYEGGETFGYWHGTILTGGAGATLPTFNFTGGCGSFNACNPTDGGILLDTQTVIASGYLNGTGTGWSGSGSVVPLQTIPVAGVTLPTTTAWGYANGLTIHATADRNITAPQTIAITMVTGTFSPGDHVCVEGHGLPDGGFDEQSIVTTVSGSNVTLPLAYPYSAVAIFKGGPCGTYISFNANEALAGYRTSYHAIASFTGSDLIYAVPSSTGLNGTLDGGKLPQGTEPETAGGTSDPNAAFQTFCGAEIDEALQSNGDAVQIDPNSCAWTVGDTVESPHFPTQSVTGMYSWINQNMPNNGHGTGGIQLDMQGGGIAGYTWGYLVNNVNNNAWYVNGGGKLPEPQCAFCATGTWLDDLRGTAPAESILKVTAHLPGQTSYKLFDDESGGFGGIISVSSAGFNFNQNVNVAGGFNGGFLNLNGAISNVGGSASFTQINLTTGSGTPTFVLAGDSGSRADFGSVAPYTTTPVTPLLSIVTGVDAQSSIVAGGNGGTPVSVFSVYTGPDVSDTNLTLENGNTHCAELICLGPGASVDSSGNAIVNNLTINGTCTGCGGGGGSYFPGTATVTPSGTPTAGQVLTATSGSAASWQTPSGGSYFPGTATVTPSGTPTAGQVLTATSGSAASWQSSNPYNTGAATITATSALTSAGGSATCVSTQCTSIRGTVWIHASSFTTGAAFQVDWTATPTAMECHANQGAGTAYYGYGAYTNATTTGGWQVGPSVSVSGLDTYVQYQCFQ